MNKKIENHPFFRKIHQELIEHLSEDLECDVEVFYDPSKINNKKKLDAIVNTVLAIFEVSADELRTKNCKRRIVDARRAIAYIADKYEYVTDRRIGVLVHRDRCTVLNLKRTAQDLYDTDWVYSKMIDKCIKELGYEKRNND